MAITIYNVGALFIKMEMLLPLINFFLAILKKFFKIYPSHFVKGLLTTEMTVNLG